jgi:heptosyltransferase II
LNQNSQNIKYLVVQTAFIGDAILATALLESLHQTYKHAQIDYMVRKGNETLFKNHPFIKNLYVWDKSSHKFKNLLKILKQVRLEKYDYIINLQRFASTGIFTAFSNAQQKLGFKKNPFSLFFTTKTEHSVSGKVHEVERNHLLIKHLTNDIPAKPKLYPSQADYEKVSMYKTQKYICISPASVWFTKQFPKKKWISFLNSIAPDLKVYMLGATADTALCDEICRETSNRNTENLAGKLNLLQSAALMQDALMNFTNDSAPMHLASAMDAPVVAIYCSTVPAFGFGPLSTVSHIVEIRKPLECRPCGLHGKKECPRGHFSCGFDIELSELLQPLNQ